LLGKYRVPAKLARSWLQNDYLVPLLDGLDEVPVGLQLDCVAAINDFIEKSVPSGIVVCCRRMEYQWLPHRLKLNGAICLEPLSAEEVGKYLASGGSKLAALREAVNKDPALQELTQTPLMLSVMSLACQGLGGDQLTTREESFPQERRNEIFRLYVEQMFQRKGTDAAVFPKEKTINWLSWLASKIREHPQSVFIVGGLQPSWLGTKTQRVAYGTVVALSLGLIAGLICGLSFWLVFDRSFWLSFWLSLGLISGLIFGLSVLFRVESWKNGAVSGSITGLIFGLIFGDLLVGLTTGLLAGLIGDLGAGSLNRIALVEAMSWRWRQFWKRTIPGSIGGLTAGLLAGLTDYRPISALIGGLMVGLITGLAGGFTDSSEVGKASPNQGIQQSLKNALAAFFATWLSVGLMSGLIAGLIAGPAKGLVVGLIFGLVVGLIFGLNRGGSAVIKHYALRLTLWLNGYTPFNFVNFLDHCARLILLKKVGGGYIFIHRMLLEYFAELTPKSPKPEDGQKAKGVRREIGLR
jgi:eukaryotic-like serine/threonine-protein kinase